MESPKIFVINDAFIAERLANSIEQPVGYIDCHEDWREVYEHGEIFIVNTEGARLPAIFNPSVELNLPACIIEYHELVRTVLGEQELPLSVARGTVWQPATWLDCNLEGRPVSRKERAARSRIKQMNDCMHATRRMKRKNVSRIIPGIQELPRAIEITLRFRERVVKLAQAQGEQIAYSTMLDHYLKHGELKKLTRKPKS